MKLHISVQVDNSAFEDPSELPHLLRELADRLSFTEECVEGNGALIYDRNGNTVGWWRFGEPQFGEALGQFVDAMANDYQGHFRG